MGTSPPQRSIPSLEETTPVHPPPPDASPDHLWLFCPRCRKLRLANSTPLQKNNNWTAVTCKGCHRAPRSSKWLCLCRTRWTQCPTHYPIGIAIAATQGKPPPDQPSQPKPAPKPHTPKDKKRASERPLTHSDHLLGTGTQPVRSQMQSPNPATKRPCPPHPTRARPQPEDGRNTRAERCITTSPLPPGLPSSLSRA